MTESTIIPTAPATSSSTDFDFLIGRWRIRNRKLKARLVSNNEWLEFDAEHKMRPVVNDFGNTDIMKVNSNDQPFEGLSLRLFNPATRLWSIYWADTTRVVLDPPVIGSFENNIGTFFGNDIYEGKKVIVKFNWDRSKSDTPVWSQAFSADNGKTWEWNWYMYFTRLH